LEKEEVIMRRFVGFFFAMILMFSFCFALPGLTQGTKETEGVYTIQKGDTLWDISSKFLRDPFLWPKLWEKNPYITNPHWIYPGNTIRLTDLELAKTEEPQKTVGEKPGEMVKAAEAPGVTEREVQKAESLMPAPVEKKREEIVEVKAEVKPSPVEEKPGYFREIRSAGFMSNLDYRGIGIVLESREGKNIMSEGDILYMALKTGEPIAIGNRYTVFRPGREIRHPVTDRRIGRKYTIAGIVQLIDQTNDFYTARVLECFDAIWIGDYIQPYSREKMEGYLAK
jgi:LysM domain-containing protein